jgi:hypothetical protein
MTSEMATIDVNQDQTVSSLEELVALVQPFRKDGKWIFRGVRQNNYQLVPKIGREGTRKGVGSPEDLHYDRDEEDTMVRHFIRSAGPYVRHVPTTRLEWLALAQHHGMFTRLLDWTESLLVAAFFAVEDARPREIPPMIYAAKGVKVIPENRYNDLDGLEDAMLYYPQHISPRIPAQSSVLTVHNPPDEPFVPPTLVRITIARHTLLTMKLNLSACGIHRASLFPDIDGLAAHQSWLYKWGEHLRYHD